MFNCYTTNIVIKFDFVKSFVNPQVNIDKTFT